MKIQEIKDKYKVGSRIKLHSMNDEFKVTDNTLGTVTLVDDMGTVHVNWDDGKKLGLIVGEDDFTLLDEFNKNYEVSKVNIKVNSPTVRKDELKPEKHQIDYAIKVSETEFFNLINDSFSEREYIKEFKELMYQDDNLINHSILVYCDQDNNGVLINSEGFSYPRYQSYINNVTELLEINSYDKEEEKRFNKIKILVVEPNNNPYVAIIDNNLETLQKMVDGPIEYVSLSDSADIILNEEGKLRNLEANRRFRNDVIVGRFIIVGNNDTEYFSSLSQRDIEKYQEDFLEFEVIDQKEVQDTFEYLLYY